MRTHRALLWLLLTGCAGGGQAVKTSGAPGPQVSLVMELKTDQGARPVQWNETLRSGDQYALRVESEAPAYVYVVQRGAAAQGPLVPGGDTAQVEARTPLLVPASGWLTLSQAPGAETIYVVAARRELSAQEQQRQIDQAVLEDPREGPPMSTSVKRGYDSERKAVLARIGESGVVVLGLKFQHQ